MINSSVCTSCIIMCYNDERHISNIISGGLYFCFVLIALDCDTHAMHFLFNQIYKLFLAIQRIL